MFAIACKCDGLENEVALSGDGSRVAYVTKAADLKQNRDVYELFIRKLSDTSSRRNGKLLSTAEGISSLQWLRDARRLSFVSKVHGQNLVSIVDTTQNKKQVVYSSPLRVTAYAIDGDGRTAAIAIEQNQDESTQSPSYPYGLPVIFGQGNPAHAVDLSAKPSALLFLRRTQAGWIATDLPLSGPAVLVKSSLFKAVRNLSFSPNSRFLAITVGVWFVPSDWGTSDFILKLEREQFNPWSVALYNLENHRLTIAFHGPVYGPPLVWATDSKYFGVDGALLDPENTDASTDVFQRAKLYVVDISRGKAIEAFAHNARVLVWKSSGEELLIGAKDGAFVRVLREGDKWKQASADVLQEIAQYDPNSYVSKDGHTIIGIAENLDTPPDLFLIDRHTHRFTVISNLNPQLGSLKFGRVERVHWSSRLGENYTGYLIKPTEYIEGSLYPLIIMAKSWNSSFICDTLYHTSFAPQPLAAHGFAVLMINEPDSPGNLGYPGKIGEAYAFVSEVENAVSFLSDSKIADPHRVGLAGFSRTSWMVDFLLTHSRLPLLCASSADSGIYNYGTYWLFNDKTIMRDYEYELAGPPYGGIRENWLKYTPAFNANEAKAPLLMEYTSQNLQSAFELFTALNRLGKPVDLFYYPYGQHELDTPLERFASLQRNVDWFRFWIQDHEGTPPSYDPSQYIRWRQLRRQQEWNDRMQARGKDPSAEFLRQTAPGAPLGNVEGAPAIHSKQN